MIIVAGYTSPGNNASPVVLYAGQSGVEAVKAIAASTLPRIERIDHPHMRVVRGFTPERLAAHEKAAQRAPKPDRAQLAAAQEIDKLRLLLAGAEKRAADATERASRLESTLATLGEEIANKSAGPENSPPPSSDDVGERIPALPPVVPGSSAEDGPTLPPIK